MKFLIVTCLLTSLVCTSSFAQSSIKIISGTIEGDSKVVSLSLNLDAEHDVVGMTVESNDPAQSTQTKDYQEHQIYSGIVLYHQSNRDIVVLSSENFSSQQGGDIELTYLYNGITGRRYSIMINLFRDGDTWKVSQNGVNFTRVHFNKNRKRFIGVVGVRSIDFMP
tara:strand:- start:334 stop:831 length:498 start_codon:yes stop_codon:yes gene_type:complete